MRILAFVFIAVSVVGCGSNSTTMPDMPVTLGPDMQKFSACGHPGDKGNSLHIGQYCDDDTPCPKSDLGLLSCSNFVNPTLPANQATFFCTRACMTAGPDPSCGENALCVCGKPGLCGCTPVACAAGMAG